MASCEVKEKLVLAKFISRFSNLPLTKTTHNVIYKDNLTQNMTHYEQALFSNPEQAEKVLQKGISRLSGFSGREQASIVSSIMVFMTKPETNPRARVERHGEKTIIEIPLGEPLSFSSATVTFQPPRTAIVLFDRGHNSLVDNVAEVRNDERHERFTDLTINAGPCGEVALARDNQTGRIWLRTLHTAITAR